MKEKASEGARIADQLRRAFDGSAWHGPALLALVKDVDAAMAVARPIADAHSIWELVLHIAAWDGAGLRRLGGKKAQLKGPANFPPVPVPPTDAAWREAVAKAKKTHVALVDAVGKLSAARLRDTVPGKRYDFYHMLHGIAQHELYHAGQIAVLKKAVCRKA